MAADLLALALLRPPGEFGADIAIGSTQRFGVPLGFGGPHAAYLSTRDDHKRQIPGRLVGVSRDRDGRPAFRLALQTREQHIRRDKATSNICTAQVLLAIMASMYGVYHGPDGLRAIAARIHALAARLAAGLKRLGLGVGDAPFFDTLRVALPKGEAARVLERAAQRRMNLRDFGDGSLGVSLDETTLAADVAALLDVFAGRAAGFGPEDVEAREEFAAPFARTSGYLTHEVFNRHHSETEMLRYIHRLQARDLSLTTSMIPLGSCTMKLNATSEMLPVTWPEFGEMHPFAPAAQTKGYAQIFRGPRGMAGRDHRLRRRLPAAQRRLAGRVRGAAGHPRVPREPGRGPAQRVPDPGLRPRHQPRERGDGRLQGRGRRLRGQRQHRRRRPAPQGGGAQGRPRRADGHLPVHLRRVRGEHPRGLRDRPCPRRAGLHGRREHERPGRPHAGPGTSAPTSAT